MYSYSCPFCQQRLLAPAERAGQKTICPKCLRPVTIPDPNEEPLGGPEVNFNNPPQSEGLDVDAQSLSTKEPDYLEEWPIEPISADIPEVQTPPPQPQPPTPPRRVLPSMPPVPPTRPASPPPPPRAPEPVPASLNGDSPAPRPRPQPVPETRPEPKPEPRPQLPARQPASANRPAPLVTRRAEAPPQPGTLVVMNPTGMASVDLAAELTAALTLRMKPPQEPPTELRLSAALAVIVTLIGVSLWTAGVVVKYVELLPFVALLGGLMFAVGWVWAIHLASLSGWFNALMALLPPITLRYLVKPSEDNGARPLLYVLSGSLLIGLFVIANPASAQFDKVMAALDVSRPNVESKPMTPAEKLRVVIERRLPSLLQDHLQTLASQDPRSAGEKGQGLDDANRTDLANELKGILKPGPNAYEPTVRAAALLAIARWCPTEGRVDVLQALSSPDPAMRRAALQEANRWPDVDMARAVCGRLIDDRESDTAVRTLKSIGSAAEKPLIELLKSEDNYFQMKIINLLEELGTMESVKALEVLSLEAAQNNTIRQDAARAAEGLRKHLRTK